MHWPATGREGSIPSVNLLPGIRYTVQVIAKFYACEGPECSGRMCSESCPPCQIYKGYTGSFAIRGEYKSDKDQKKFGAFPVAFNYSESKVFKGRYYIDFLLRGDVKPPATIKLFAIIGGGQNPNYMIANVQAGKGQFLVSAITLKFFYLLKKRA